MVHLLTYGLENVLGNTFLARLGALPSGEVERGFQSPTEPELCVSGSCHIAEWMPHLRTWSPDSFFISSVGATPPCYCPKSLAPRHPTSNESRWPSPEASAKHRDGTAAHLVRRPALPPTFTTGRHLNLPRPPVALPWLNL